MAATAPVDAAYDEAPSSSTVTPRRRSRGALFVVLAGEALRAIVRHRGRSALTMLGIAIAIAAVVWVVALGRESASRYAELLRGLGDNLVWVEAGGRNIAGVRLGSKTTTTLTVGDMQAILEDVPLVRRASPQVDASVQIVSERSNWKTTSRGIAPDYLAIKRWVVGAGAPFTDDDVGSARNVILLGQTVRERLFGPEDALGKIVRVDGQPFEVVGMLAPKGQSASGYDMDDTAMVPYTTSLKELRPPGIPYVDDIVCSAISADAVEEATARITALVRERHHIQPGADDDFNIRHPEDIVKAQLESSETFATLLTAVACVALLVGGIGVMNVMLASVTERTREIGLRLALGATEGAVLLQFIAEAVLLSGIGGIVGVVLSVLGASGLGSLLGWPLSVPVDAVAVGIAVSTTAGVLFGFLPARRAARLDPIDALRSD
jgi:putative ABC transport system permease protein